MITIKNPNSIAYIYFDGESFECDIYNHDSEIIESGPIDWDRLVDGLKYHGLI